MTGGASGGQPCAGSRLGATGVMGSLLLCRGLPTPGRGWPGVGMRPGTGRLQPPVCRCGDGVRSRPWSAGPGQRRALRLTPKRQRLRGQGSRRALVVPLAGQRVALTHASRTARLGLGQRKPSPRGAACRNAVASGVALGTGSLGVTVRLGSHIPPSGAVRAGHALFPAWAKPLDVLDLVANNL